MLHTVRGKPLFLAPEINKIINSNPAESVCSYNAVLNDVFGLGMVFLGMKHLEVSPSEEHILNAVRSRQEILIIYELNFSLRNFVEKMKKNK